MAPIIICGMHRSGTSLVSRSLEMAGLFAGHEKEHNNEALFFLDLNQWMFEQLGATWDNTYNMRFTDNELADYFQKVIGNYISSNAFTSYTGTEPDPQTGLSPVPDTPWGWKDPRNTFTAMTWSRIFPGAKLVHVCRNPLDVADSLRRREYEILEGHREQLAQVAAGDLDGSLRLQQSPRMFHLAECLSLWEDYVTQALQLEKQFGVDAIRVRYEDFLADPVTELSRLAKFSGLAPAEEQLHAATTTVNPARRFAFMQNDELMSAYCDYRNNDVVKTLGYDRLHESGCDTAA